MGFWMTVAAVMVGLFLAELTGVLWQMFWDWLG